MLRLLLFAATVLLISESTNLIALPYTTPVAGGPGGAPFQSLCPPEKVMIGIRGRNGSVLDRIEAICTAVSNDGTWVSGTTSFAATAGGSGGSSFDIRCSAGQAVTSFKGRAGNFIDNVQIACSRLGTGGKFNTSPSFLSQVAGGSGGGAYGPHDCTQNRPSKGLIGKAGNVVDSMAMICDVPLIPPEADLVINGMSANPNAVGVNENFNLRVDVKNIGAAGASSFEMKVGIPGGSVFRGNQGAGFSCNLSGSEVLCKRSSLLNPGQTATAEMTFQAPNDPGPASSQARVDWNGKVTESSDSNNTGNTGLQYFTRPDLELKFLNEITTARVGTTYDFKFQVKNIGRASADQVRVEFVFNGDEGQEIIEPIVATNGVKRLTNCSVENDTGISRATCDSTGPLLVNEFDEVTIKFRFPAKPTFLLHGAEVFPARNETAVNNNTLSGLSITVSQ